MNQESNEDDIVNIINKIIVITSESENLTKSLLYVIEIMTDDTPENDLPQDSLESLVFTSKQKINGFKIRFDENKGKLTTALSKMEIDTRYGDISNDVLNKCLNSINENEMKVKMLTSTAMKWEVGSSEVIKEIRKSISECKEEIKKNNDDFTSLKESVLELVETFSEQIGEYDEKFKNLDEVTTHLSENSTPLKMFNDFKNSLISVLEKENSSKPIKNLIKYS